MRGGRGQITLFFIVGLVVLLLVILLYFFVSMEEDIVQAERTLEVSGSGPLANAVGSCIDTVVQEEISLLGRNGGLLDTSRYPHAIVGDGVMLYGLTMNRDIPGGGTLLPYALPVPAYPHPHTTLRNATIEPSSGRAFESFQAGFFGDLNFPAICSLSGPNAPLGPRSCRSYPGRPPGTPHDVVQENLEQRILQRIQQCASPRLFSQALGANVEQTGPPAAEIAFTYVNTIVEISYPLTLDGKSETGVVRRVYPIRFMPLMQFAIDLAREESRNITFNISEDYRDLRSFRQGFTVDVAPVEVLPQDPQPTPSLSQHALQVGIIDSRSEIDGLSYSFTFLIERRPPVLDLLEGSLSCIAMQNQPLATLAANRQLGRDPDDLAVRLRWCHENEALLGPCPSTYKLYVVDSDGEMDWETTTCPVTTGP